MDDDSQSIVTSINDLGTGCITPAILSDPLMAVTVNLVVDDNTAPSIMRVEDDTTSAERGQYMKWAAHYINISSSNCTVHN